MARGLETATRPEDLADLESFAAESKRRRVTYREGDVFAFRHTRREWGFGRVLMDRAQRCDDGYLPREQQNGYLQYLGRVVLVQLFHRLAETPEVEVDELVELPAMPSHMVTDIGLFSGEWPIIGYAPLADEDIDHELLSWRSLCLDDTWFIQDGFRYRELPEAVLFERLPREVIDVLEHTSFAVASSGPSLSTDTLRACIEAGTNDPYWGAATHDLRSPQNAAIRHALLQAFADDR